MDVTRWAAIQSLYHAALEKEAGERSSFLAEACAEDPALRGEIESLLAYADVRLSSPGRHSEMLKLVDRIAWIPVSGPPPYAQANDDGARVNICSRGNDGWLEPGIDSRTAGEPELVGAAAAGIKPPLPAAIGRYRILRLLSEGGMGTVYEANRNIPAAQLRSRS
jgi:hypothetical protein